MIVGVDAGRSFVKAYAGEGRSIIFPSFACPATYRELVSSSDEYEVTINGKSWFTGELARLEGGTEIFEKDKVNHENTVPLIMTALASLARSDKEIVSLITGLPISDYREQSKLFIDRLKGVWSVKLGRKEVELHIVDVLTFPEGAGAAWSTVLGDNGKAHSRPDMIRCIDVGGKTTDFSVFNKLRFVASESSSLPLGITWAQNDTYRRLAGKLDVMPSEVKPDEQALQSLAKRIQNELNKWWRHWDNVVLAGGGALLLRDYLPYRCVSNPQLANAVGYYRVGMAKWAG